MHGSVLLQLHLPDKVSLFSINCPCGPEKCPKEDGQCLFDIKSWSDYIQPTYWTSVISWHSWQHIHIERNKIWSDQARSWVSACIKMIRGLRSHFFSWGKTAMGWLWVTIISVSLQSMSKDFLTLKAAEWITQHSASIVSWYLDTVSSHHDLFLSISFHSCPTTALAVFNSSPACPFLCSFTWPFYLFPPCSPDCRPHSGFYFSAFKTGFIFPNPCCQNSS